MGGGGGDGKATEGNSFREKRQPGERETREEEEEGDEDVEEDERGRGEE